MGCIHSSQPMIPSGTATGVLRRQEIQSITPIVQVKMVSSCQETFVGITGAQQHDASSSSARNLSALTVPTPQSVASTRTYQASPTGSRSFANFDARGSTLMLGDPPGAGGISVSPAPQGRREPVDVDGEQAGFSLSAIRAYYGITDFPTYQPFKAPFRSTVSEDRGLKPSSSTVDTIPMDPIKLEAITPVVLTTEATPQQPADAANESASISSANLALLIDVMPGAVIAFEAKGMVMRCNQPAASMFGYSIPEMLGMGSGQLLCGNLEILTAPYGGTHAALLNSLGQGCATTGKRQDGTVFPMQLALNPVRQDSNQTVTLMTVVDVSNRIIMSEQPDNTESATDAKKDGAMDKLSHEIRSPLMGIIGFAELMAVSPMPERQKEMVDSVSKCADAMMASLVCAEQHSCEQ